MIRLLLIISILLLSVLTYADQTDLDPFPQNTGTIYEYDEPPAVYFFPADKAKWDGYKITASVWHKLTDGQKVAFIEEGAKEIERNEGVKVVIKDEPMLLIGINGSVSGLPEDVPMIKFLRDLIWLLNAK
jgi:maltose-binding protein MalE